jgi:hypothetical protein
VLVVGAAWLAVTRFLGRAFAARTEAAERPSRPDDAPTDAPAEGQDEAASRPAGREA